LVAFGPIATSAGIELNVLKAKRAARVVLNQGEIVEVPVDLAWSIVDRGNSKDARDG